MLTFEKLVSEVKSNSSERVIVVAHATDFSLFEVAKEAIEKKFSSFIFTGPMNVMNALKEQVKLTEEQLGKIEFVDTKSEIDSASCAIGLIRDRKANVLMKGMLSTSVLLKAVLRKDIGLRTGNILSHIAGFSIPNKEQLLFITDAAMNIAPDLNEKVQITKNAVEAVNKIGIKNPKVAVLAAVETVNSKMQATMDASELTAMYKNGQISNCTLEGPLSFDIAISPEAALQKNVHSEVAGQADVLVVPTIEVGNVLYKSLTYFGGATVGGMILGAAVPIILTSRADSVQSKLFSMAMAIRVSSAN